MWEIADGCIRPNSQQNEQSQCRIGLNVLFYFHSLMTEKACEIQVRLVLFEKELEF